MRLTIVILFGLTSTFTISSQDWLEFDENIPVSETCDGTYSKHLVPVNFYNNGLTTIMFKGSNIPSLKLYYKGKHIKENEIFKIENKQDLRKISIDFLVNTTIKEPHFRIKQIVDDHVKSEKIKLNFGHFLIESFSGSIKISDACKDSITLIFPFQGTQTDSYLREEINGVSKSIRTKTYYCCTYGNKYKVSKNNLSKYSLHLVGCHSSKTYNFETK